jgi:hypothetical protein
MSTAISLLATVITFVFAAAVLRQYIERPRPYKLAWVAALLCYGLATLAQFAAALHGWTVFEFRLWYLSGGLLTAAYLGQGTAMLLLPRRVGRGLLVALLLLSIVALWRSFTAPIALSSILPPAGKISPQATHLPADLRLLAAVLNIYGTLLLVGGALWSCIIYFDRSLDHRRRAGYRALSTLLIAAGSFIVALAGSFEALGQGEFLYLAEIIGITVIFLGFLRSRETMGLPHLEMHAARAEPEGTPDRKDEAGEYREVRHLRSVSERLRRG